MNNVIDLSAKLLANEDINVARANTKTASFDIKSRVLTLPMWQEMTPAIEQMLVGHEVGHALYTTDEYSDTIKENTSLKSYLNVLEDVRIEKLMKKKYPGIRKYMTAGYKELNDRDFFGIEGKDVNKMLLIDRINLYFKASLFNLDFSPEEKQFVVRAERTESIQDVIELAKEVYEYSKEEYEKMMEEMENDPEYQDDEDDDDFDMEFEDADGDTDFDEEDGDTEIEGSPGQDSDDEDDQQEDGQESYQQRGAEGDSDEQLESKTQKAFDKNLDELADTDTVYQYFKFYDYKRDPVIGFKRILKELPEDLENRYIDNRIPSRKDSFTSFKEESARTVNYLVKEFEMRKSAAQYKRTQTAKSGSLDMKKIFGYQINDDLFKRVQIVPDGKNHGMMILVDWSGSMQNVITNTIKQVINLAMFCQRTQIPYRVYAFTNNYYDKEKRAAQRSMTYEERNALYEQERAEMKEAYESEQGYLFCTDYHMLELFSNQMTSSDFWNMSRLLLDPALIYTNRFGLGSTPLNEALIWIYQNIGKFIKGNNVEKMTFITLTDGEGADLHANKSLRESRIDKYGYYDHELERQIPNSYINYRNMIVDEVTKKTYRIKNDANSQTRMIIKMIKDRYDVRTVGFYICQNTRRDIYWAIRSNTNLTGYDFNEMAREMRKDFRQEGFHSLAGSGRDELFIIPQHKLNIEEEELKADGEMTARKLASQFGKYLNKKKTSRVLLNKFIGWVA
jgi:hypothetical protein